MLSVADIGVKAPRVLLPRKGIDVGKWAVVAVDQYTTQLDYWKKVDEIVGDEPSTLRLVFPEVYLEDDDKAARVKKINETMKSYADREIFEEFKGFVYIERVARQRLRKGLMAALDLEAYDFTKGSTTLVRATEGTIVDRLPPRMDIRRAATIELPHILVLIDDRECSVIEPLAQRKDKMQQLYDTELMMEGGHVSGWLVDEDAETRLLAALQKLSDPKAHGLKYSLDPETPVLLYAMGDGNHSLATAKAIWEEHKKNNEGSDVMDSKLRYALVEIENVHDEAITFEPIHRVLFNVAPGVSIIDELEKRLDGFSCKKAGNLSALEMAIKDQTTGGLHRFGMVSGPDLWVAEAKPNGNICSGTLQQALDEILKTGLGLVLGNPKGKTIDYVHGAQQTIDDSQPKANFGFILPAMQKDDLFRSVIVDGALPRKTFSMGEADEKRFYVEARALQ